MSYFNILGVEPKTVTSRRTKKSDKLRKHGHESNKGTNDWWNPHCEGPSGWTDFVRSNIEPVAVMRPPSKPKVVPPRNKMCDLIQLDISNAELLRRIESFQCGKREEINRENILEFCQASYVKGGHSCARVDAVVIKRSDGKSHVKVHRVVNEWGPQLGGTDPDAETLSNAWPQFGVTDPEVESEPPDPEIEMKPHLEDDTVADPVSPGIEERLRNAEAQLKFGGPVPVDVYKRLSFIEETLLNLEGVSPEYADEKIDRVRVGLGRELPHIPMTKRRFARHDLRRRLSLLANNKVGKKRKSGHPHRIKKKEVKSEIKKEITKKEITKKEMTKKEITKKEITKKEITKKEITKKEITKKGITKKGITKKGITKKEITKKEITKKKPINKRKKK